MANEIGTNFPVNEELLAQSRSSGELDENSKKLKEAEKKYIKAWREARGDEQNSDSDNLVGLALSGGGIRSATFSLGIMQALAFRGLLKKVDYLSTVSGGGYIGSALTWLVSHKAQSECKQSGTTFGLNKEDFPFGADDPAPDAEQTATKEQQGMLKYLRQHGYYLTPGSGIDAFSLLGVVLRSTILNLMICIPAIILFFLFGMWGAQQIATHSPDLLSTPILTTAFNSIYPETQCSKEIPDAIAVTPLGADSVCATLKSQDAFLLVNDQPMKLFGFELFLWIGAAIGAVLLLGTMVYSFFTWLRRGKSRESKEYWYNQRRYAEKLVAIVMPVALVTITVGSMPVIAVYLHSWLLATGPIAMLLGIIVAIRNFMASASNSNSGSSEIIAIIGSALFLYGVLLIAYQIALALFSAEWVLWIAPGLVILMVVIGWCVNLNYISIHRYYRDRLMETFMPDICDALKNETGAAYGADEATLQSISDVERPTGPYHIVNTNLVLVNSSNKTYRSRGGDNFILSPLYCGSNATGWCQTTKYMKGHMTLATAVAISGAAANPNTGVGGKGLTRNLMVSMVMALLNLRLGYWACNPDSTKQPSHGPNHFLPGVYNIGNAMGLERWFGFNENQPFIELSDGGHFENTGVYELVRRRVKLIIACDGGADPDFSFSDFQTTIRRIEDDFGARVKVLEGATPDDIVPVDPKVAKYPKDAKFAKQGHMVGRITYADNSEGIIIYLKTTLIDDLSFKVKGYAAKNRDFPDQTTADQFFDETQFEAYRELGFRLAATMLNTETPDELKPEGETPYTLETLIQKNFI